MEILLTILAIAGIALILKILFWFLVIKSVVNHVKSFEKDEQQLMKLIHQQNHNKKQGSINPKMTHEVTSRILQMQNHLRQMDDIRRQQYETRMGDLVSSATSAGFTNFNPGSF